MNSLTDFKIPPSEKVRVVHADMVQAYHPNMFITDVNELFSAYPEFTEDNIINNTDLDWKDVLKRASPHGKKNRLEYVPCVLKNDHRLGLEFLVKVRNVIFLFLRVRRGNKSLIFSLLYQLFNLSYFKNTKSRSYKRAEFIYIRESIARNSLLLNPTQPPLSDEAIEVASPIIEEVPHYEGDGVAKSISTQSLEDFVKTLNFSDQDADSGVASPPTDYSPFEPDSFASPVVLGGLDLDYDSDCEMWAALDNAVLGAVGPHTFSPCPQAEAPEDVSPQDASPQDVSILEVPPQDVSPQDVSILDMPPQDLSPQDASVLDVSTSCGENESMEGKAASEVVQHEAPRGMPDSPSLTILRKKSKIMVTMAEE